MNEQLQERIQAWVDGELPAAEAAEVAAWVGRDPAARALADNLRSFAGVLRRNEPEHVVSEGRDFYWSRIRQGIEKAERAEASSAPSAAGRGIHPPRWLTWLLPASAAALAAVFFYHPGGTISAGRRSEGAPTLVGHVVEAPSDEVSTLTFYSAQDSMTVVWLGKIDFL